MMGNRRQPFDATFGQEKTDAVTFHRNGVADHRPVVSRRSRPSTTATRTATGPRQPVGVHQGGRLGHDDDRHEDP